MVNENLIRFIVETYELPKPLEEKIFRIAYTTIKDLGLSGFDSQYRHIANLIEKFKAPYQERFFLRLDSSEDFTEKQSHEIIGFEDNNLERVIALEEENKGLISFREALGILEHELDREDYLFLNALVNLGNYDITNKKFNSLLLKDPSNIQDEIRILRNRFEINGVFLLPPRPILDLQFNPLKVKFNKIEYPGSPLPFFNKYRKIYGLLTRQQLKHFDRALHKALYKSKEMNLAIPRVFSGLLSDASIKEIIRSHESFNGNATKAAEYFGHGSSMVRKLWNINGLTCLGRGGKFRKLSGKDVIAINNAYEQFMGNAKRCSESLGISLPTIIKYWRRAGYEIQASGGGSHKK